MVVPVYYHVDARRDGRVHNGLDLRPFDLRVRQVAVRHNSHGSADQCDIPVLYQPLHGLSVVKRPRPLRPEEGRASQPQGNTRLVHHLVALHPQHAVNVDETGRLRRALLVVARALAITGVWRHALLDAAIDFETHWVRPAASPVPIIFACARRQLCGWGRDWDAQLVVPGACPVAGVWRHALVHAALDLLADWARAARCIIPVLVTNAPRQHHGALDCQNCAAAPPLVPVCSNALKQQPRKGEKVPCCGASHCFSCKFQYEP
mmetsp:Transcript_83871/g.237613  ORF Transcript_83871/g.237613 Transcript_83871/m.237613 type:complete len:263 (+) Transcript_83871:547-1335(+)